MVLMIEMFLPFRALCVLRLSLSLLSIYQSIYLFIYIFLHSLPLPPSIYLWLSPESGIDPVAFPHGSPFSPPPLNHHFPMSVPPPSIQLPYPLWSQLVCQGNIFVQYSTTIPVIYGHGEYGLRVREKHREGNSYGPLVDLFFKGVMDSLSPEWISQISYLRTIFIVIYR